MKKPDTTDRIKRIVSVFLSITITLVSVFVVYIVVNQALSITNPDSYLALLAEKKEQDLIVVSGYDHSLDGFPFILFIIPFGIALLLYFINKYVLNLSTKRTIINVLLVFIIVLGTLLISAIRYYNDYGKTILKIYDREYMPYVPDEDTVYVPLKESDC